MPIGDFLGACLALRSWRSDETIREKNHQWRQSPCERRERHRQRRAVAVRKGGESNRLGEGEVALFGGLFDVRDGFQGLVGGEVFDDDGGVFA